MTIESLSALLGWCSIINIAILLLSTLAMVTLRDMMTGIHSRLFNVDVEALQLTYLQYLGNYKIAVIVLNIVPYLALKLMADT